MELLMMCKVYTNASGIKITMFVIHSLKLVNYLQVQADNPWYNYDMLFFSGIP